MNCELASTLMAFARPGELGPEDQSAFEAHLAGCPACAAEWVRRAAFDRSVGTQMLAVALPVGGRRRAAARVRHLARVRALKGWGRAASAGLAAAVLLGFGAGVYHRTRPALDAESLVMNGEHVLDSPDQVLQQFLAEHGWPDELPGRLDACNLVGVGTQTVQGRQVPAITLVKPAGDKLERCVIYLIGREQFQTAGLRPTAASLYTLTPLADPRHPGRKWVAVHTTPDLAPFRRPDVGNDG